MLPNEARLVKLVQGALTPELIRPEFRHRPDRPMFGHCYHASEALYHLLGGKAAGYKAMRGVDDEGTSHYWVVSPRGEILDTTAAQFDGRALPYHTGKGCAFRAMSNSARDVIERVKCATQSPSP